MIVRLFRRFCSCFFLAAARIAAEGPSLFRTLLHPPPQWFPFYGLRFMRIPPPFPRYCPAEGLRACRRINPHPGAWSPFPGHLSIKKEGGGSLRSPELYPLT